MSVIFGYMKCIMWEHCQSASIGRLGRTTVGALAALTILAGVCRQVVDDSTVIPLCREGLLGYLCRWPASPARSFTLTLELVFFLWSADWAQCI